ncbi:MAG: flagellar filament capping protein FliD, partial [Candidatus Kapabacteria bacterium]|nr:flagellar filament capping protein FliD [Candidatus Kapabacteria bacterium]
SAASAGVNTVKVQRMATNDVLVSAQTTLATASGIAAGASAFRISGRDYSVTFDGTETNEQAIAKIVSAINTDSNKNVTASLVKDTSSTGRLSLTATDTGKDKAITFTDTDGVLARFGLTSSLQQTTSGTQLQAQGALTDKTTASTLSNGSKSFRINGVQFTVAHANGDTAETLMNRVTTAIANTSTSSVTASTEAGGGNQMRLNIQNNAIGGTLSIEDTDGLLASLGLAEQTLRDQRTTARGTGAGYRAATEYDLNSSALINGIEVTRSKNTVDDALTGLTLTYAKAQAASDAPLTITTSVNTDGVATTVKGLLDSYNEALRFLQNESKKAGNDGAVRSLTQRLRGVTGQTYGTDSSVKFLSDAGISIGRDGTLTVGDKTKLTTLLQDDPAKAAGLFTGANGLAQTLRNIVNDVSGTDGLASTRSNALRSQITRVSDQRKTLETRVDREVEQQKREYRKLQESYYQLQGQLSQYSSYR